MNNTAKMYKYPSWYCSSPDKPFNKECLRIICLSPSIPIQMYRYIYIYIYTYKYIDCDLGSLRGICHMWLFITRNRYATRTIYCICKLCIMQWIGSKIHFCMAVEERDGRIYILLHLYFPDLLSYISKYFQMFLSIL